ncbi:hypothetical protein Sste5346_007046, partial [Sporothrix stenoceras]
MPTEPDSTGGGRSEHDDTPWITVSAKGGRRRGRQAVDRAISFHASPGPPGSGPANESVPPAASTGTALGDEATAPAYVEAEHARVVGWWRSQPSYASLVDLIERNAPGRAVINRA